MDKAGHILKNLLGEALSREAQKYSSFFHFFENILGERLSSQIEIKDIVNGIIHAEASHPGWIQTFSMKKSFILYKVRERYPDLKIKDIHVKLSASGIKKKDKKASVHNEPIENTINKLSDEEKQKVLKQIFSWKKRNKIY